MTLSFEPDEKNNTNKYIRKGKIKFIKHKLSFSKASNNNTFESNKEKKTFKLIIGNQENDKNNLIV